MRVFLVLVLVLLTGPAFAASVNLDPIYHAFNEFLQTVLEGVAMAVSGWLMFIFHKYLTPWIGAQMEAKARESLNTALANGVQIAMSTVEGAEKAHSDVQVKGQLAAWAAQYAIDHAPEAVCRFGLNPNDLALKALAYIPPAPTTVGLAAVAVKPVGAVEVKELPPIAGQ